MNINIRYFKAISTALLIVSSLFCGRLSAQKLDFVMDMVHNNPGEQPYVTKYNEPAFLVAQGFNAKVVQWHISNAITFDNFKQNIVPKKSAERAWIETKAADIKPKLAACKKAGLQVYAFTDFLVLPVSIWNKYGAQIRDDSTIANNAEASTKPSIQRKMTQQLLIAQIDGMFTTFPDLDGIVLRFGETYLHDAPFHKGNSPIHNNYNKGIRDHITLINILREEICVKRNKKLFYRTWDFGFKFHNNPTYYLAVTNAIETHPNLFFSIKYQQGDFHRMTPFNPSIGMGKHRQIVESQSRMEAYGKAAHPYYTGAGVIDGWPETKYEISYNNNAFTGKLNPPDLPRGLKDILGCNLLAGVITWSQGGGWQGPYIQHEIWTDLNTYVVGQWAQNTRKTEAELFKQFADSLGFSGADADRFRQIALISVEAVRKGQLNSYTSNSVWWTRDEYFSTSYNNGIVAKLVEGNLTAKVLAEKAEASALWLQIEALSNQLGHPNEDLLSAIRVSCTYGRIKFQLIEQMWILMVADQMIVQKKELPKATIQMAIDRYDALWNEWRQLKKENKYCATIYTDMAFRNEIKGSVGELVEKLRKMIF